jgi:hypothetical protein
MGRAGGTGPPCGGRGVGLRPSRRAGAGRAGAAGIPGGPGSSLQVGGAESPADSGLRAAAVTVEASGSLQVDGAGRPPRYRPAGHGGDALLALRACWRRRWACRYRATLCGGPRQRGPRRRGGGVGAACQWGSDLRRPPPRLSPAGWEARVPSRRLSRRWTWTWGTTRSESWAGPGPLLAGPGPGLDLAAPPSPSPPDGAGATAGWVSV